MSIMNGSYLGLTSGGLLSLAHIGAHRPCPAHCGLHGGGSDLPSQSSGADLKKYRR